MPATDVYWRNLKRLHVWFAVSAVALLLVTIWMMWADHSREYFKYQQTFYQLQALKAEAKIEAIETAAYKAEIRRLEQAVADAERDETARADVIDLLRNKLNDAQLKYSLAEAELKLRKSQRDVARANRNLAVRDEKSPPVISDLQARYEQLQKRVDAQTLEVERLKAERDAAQEALSRETNVLTEAKAALKNKQQEVELLMKSKRKVQPESGGRRFKRWIMEWPVLQGFNSHLRVHQDWLPNLPITLGMTQTARFDRCRTCHLGADHVEAGNVPTFPHGTITQQEADEFHAARRTAAGKEPNEKWGKDDPRLWVALNKVPHPYATHPNPNLYATSSSPHPVATFGCTICHDGNGSGTSFQNAEHGPGNPYEAKQWKDKYHYHANHFWEYPMKPSRTLQSTCLKCHHTVEELGTHPKYGNSAPKVFSGYRLIQRFGCFGCHEIHGHEGDKTIGPDLRLEPNYTEAALQFRWLLRREARALLEQPGKVSPRGLLKQQYDAFAKAKRPGKKRTDGKPAAKTQAKNGRNPLTPAPTEVDEILNAIIDTPDDSAEARAKLTAAVEADLRAKSAALAELNKQRGLTAKQRAERRQRIEEGFLPRDAVALLDQFKDAAHPGKYRKVGPSLRYIRSKTSRAFIRYWTEEPKRFRPTTRMPQFFKLTNLQDAHGAQLSQVELAAVAEYLHDKSQPIDLLAPAKGYQPNANDGRVFFEQKGCLACHSHKSVPGSKADFGPDLSLIAAKVKRNPDNAAFSNWLYTWLREPQRYHKRSKMPQLFLSTSEEVAIGGDKAKAGVKPPPAKKQVKKQPEGKKAPAKVRKADVAADITAYLLQVSDDESLRKTQFRNHADDRNLIPEERREQFVARIDEMMRLYLAGKALTSSQVDRFYETRRYPVTDLSRIKGDEIELATGTRNGKPNDADWDRLRLRYLGRRTISRYGCYACHDVPGFERARPIGTTLQDWGRKENTKLAFEHMAEYLRHHGEPDGSSTLRRAKQAVASAKAGSFTDPKVRERELGVAYFVDQIMHHNRDGFIWQKLRQPRSYDYEMIETKGYDERLRMPKFPFTDQQIEQVTTFVLGLVAEPPPHDYQYKPAGASLARVEGERLLNKYNCTGCHMVELPTTTYYANLKVAFGKGSRPDSPDHPLGHSLLMRLMPPREVPTPDSLKKAGRNVPPDLTKSGQDVFENDATLTRVSFRGLKVFDPDEDPGRNPDDPASGVHYFHNWEHLDIDGRLFPPSDRSVRVPRRNLVSTTPGRGGDFAEWLFRRQKDEYKKTVPSFGTKESNLARHQIPPVLYREGYKVQTPWLYEFLRDPHQIRKTTVLRMPRFNMSSLDARMLANYFAAVDGVPFPYQNVPQRTRPYLESQNAKYTPQAGVGENGDWLSQGWKRITFPKSECRTCHSLGGYAVVPGGKDAIDAPNLQYAPDRLRPDWALLWISNPKWVTPYTAMPINFDRKQTRNPQYFGGNESVQIIAVRDALMNYHKMMEQYGRAELFAPEKKPEGRSKEKQPADPSKKEQPKAKAIKPPGANDSRKKKQPAS